jgi:negative regulator of sigma-B (phosphoserine phosphatase)
MFEIFGGVDLNTYLEWGIALQRKPGEVETGDLYLVKPFPEGYLVAVIDGVGHGREAAIAAQSAASILEANPQEKIDILIQHCHEALKNTRGAALTLATFNCKEMTMTWEGIGNVEGIICSNSLRSGASFKSLLLRPGIVGCHLPSLQENSLNVSTGDTLILATDGIHYCFSQGLDLSASPQEIAENILRRYAKGNDDALVLVARLSPGGKHEY